MIKPACQRRGELTGTMILFHKQRIKVHHVFLLVLLQQREVRVHEQSHNSKAEMQSMHTLSHTQTTTAS